MDVRINFVTGADDIKAASTFVLRRGSVLRKANSGGLRRVVAIVAGLVVLSLIVIIATTPPPAQRPPHTESKTVLLVPLVIFAVFAVLAIVGGRIARRSYWRYVKEHAGLDERYGPTTLDVGDDGLHVDYASLSLIYKWHGISGVDEDDNYIYVSSGPTQAVPVPKRAFATTADADLFRDAVRGKMRVRGALLHS